MAATSKSIYTGESSDSPVSNITNLLTMEKSKVYLGDIKGNVLYIFSNEEYNKYSSGIPEAVTAAIKEGVSLKNIDLRSVDLRGAILDGGDLEGADLSGADLSKASMIGTNLKNADMRYSCIWSTNLSRANLEGANLKRCSFNKRTIIDGANFKDAIMVGKALMANLTSSN